MALPFAGWLLAGAIPLVKKALIGIGIGVITYEGVTQALNYARDQVVASWGLLPGNVAQVLALFGFNEFFGIVLGAIAARAAFTAVARFGRITS